MPEFKIPDLKEGIGSLSYCWDKWSLRIDVLRSKDYDSELWIYQKNGSGQYHLMDAFKIDLLGSRSEDTFVKRLKTKEAELEWSDIFRYVVGKSLEIYRRGEPLQQLGKKPKRMALEYLVYPIIEKGKITILYAPGGTCKSYVAIGLACAVQFNAGVFTDLKPAWLSDNGNVLYLDWEADLATHERRVWAVKKGAGIEDDRTFDYLFCDQPLVTIADQIQRHINERNIVLTIIDSQMAASSYGLDAGMVATSFNNAARSFRTAVLIIDHMNKVDWRFGNETGKSSGTIGSVVKYNRARSAYEIQKSQEAGSSFVDLSIIHTKHNDGIIQKPIGMRINFKNDESGVLDEVTFESTELKDNPELVKTMSVQDAVADALKEGPATLEELATMTGCRKSTMKTKLNAYKKRFAKNGDLWALSTQASMEEQLDES